MLSDDVLLAVFDFCAGENPLIFVLRWEIEVWQSLVHVCRRWRSIVFGSPRRLNLRLFCTSGTLTDALDVWPPLPLVISDRGCLTRRLDNTIALLEHNDRVCQINFMSIPSSPPFENVLEAMEKPFPELTDLVIWCYDIETMPLLPDSFLGGSAPRLRNLSFNTIAFPGLPELLLSATQLVGLFLWDIPHSGYISPETIVAVLSTLVCLESLHLQFLSPRSRPDQATQHLRSPTHSALPVLTELRFKGVVEYSEDLVARVDVPQLSTLDITLLKQVVFDTPQLVEFICRTPQLKVLENARIVFDHDEARVTLSSETSDRREFSVEILCEGLDRQLSSLTQIFTSSLPLSTLQDLYVSENQNSQLDWENDIEITAWLEMLHPFEPMRHMYAVVVVKTHV